MLIDCLGSGGAQRQLATLAVGLKRRGHQVRFLSYHPQDHFLPLLKAAEIPCEVIPPCSRLQRLLAVRRILRAGSQDVVLAFLEGPSFYAELARLPGSRWGLVVSERSGDPRIHTGSGRRLRQFHRLADVVVANSHTNRLMLEAEFPFLDGKLVTIYNTVDLNLFKPHPEACLAPNVSKPDICRIVVAASYQENKNMMGLARALLHLRRSGMEAGVVVDWYGAAQPTQEAYEKVRQYIAENGLTAVFRLHSPTHAIEDEFAKTDAVGLFSFYEGLPNAVCEGMACGKPILMSNVCDAGNLVKDGVNGFLCDPDKPESIAAAISRFVRLPSEKRQQMGRRSRLMAEELFLEQTVVACYESILVGGNRKAVPSNQLHWPESLPASATNLDKSY